MIMALMLKVEPLKLVLKSPLNSALLMELKQVLETALKQVSKQMLKQVCYFSFFMGGEGGQDRETK